MTGWIVGVDGCPGGWIAAATRPGEPPAAPTVHRSLADLFSALHDVAVLAIDMPIGLPDQVGPGGRGPEAALRHHLGQRQSSVFSVPSRAAVMCPDYAAACAAAWATSDPPRKVSKQCFHLFPKVRELDDFLRADPVRAGRVFESHPEGAFMTMNGGRPLAQPKKVKSQPHGPGLEERRDLLLRAGLPEALVTTRPPRGAAWDDLLDACACLVVAGRIQRGEARSFPAEPGRDRHGLPMAIWA
jgi:predicted RNase H-like nuclease